MSKFTVTAKFNKQTKDSEKELLQFYVENDKTNPLISELTGSAVFLSIYGVDVDLSAHFAKSANDGKKAVLDFVVKGDKSAVKTFEFYKSAGQTVDLTVTESQKTLDEYNEEGQHEGIKYHTDKNGVVSRPDSDPNQATLDEITEAQQQAAAGSEQEKDDGDSKEL